MKNNFKKNKNPILTYGAVVIILAVVLVFVIKANGGMTGFVIGESSVNQEKYYAWLVDNCECLEHERVFCREGFELEDRICRGYGRYTNVLLGCSKYSCSGEIVSWDDKIKLWSPVLMEDENEDGK